MEEEVAALVSDSYVHIVDLLIIDDRLSIMVRACARPAVSLSSQSPMFLDLIAIIHSCRYSTETVVKLNSI